MTLEPDEPFSFTDLADRLSEEDGAEYASSALQRLITLKTLVDRKIGEGVGQQDYEGLRKVSEALGAAMTIMALQVKSRTSDVRSN